MFALIANNLLRRSGRTLLTALGVGVGVAMIVALLAVTQGLQNSASQFIHLGGSDLGLFQSGVADPTASVLPESLVERVQRSSLISRATPVLLIVEGIPGQPAAVAFGSAPGSFFMRNLVIGAGKLPGAGEVVVGSNLAAVMHLRIGQALTVKSTRLRVAGIYHSGVLYEDSGAVMPLSVAQAISGRQSEETLIALQLAAGVRAQSAGKALEAAFPGTQVISTPEQAARAGANASLIANAVNVIILVALIIGAISVTNTMAMSTIERQGEFALLSTVGWSALQVGTLIVGEGIAVSLIGAAIGLVLGVAGAYGLVGALGAGPFISPSVTAWGLGRGLLIGIAIGILGGIYPAWRATRLPPLKGLARA